MKLKAKSIWIFILLLILLAIVAVDQSPLVIGITIGLGSLLVIFQTVIILKDH